MSKKVDLEETAESVGGEKERYLASAAVSLKRIATVLEWFQTCAKNLAGDPKAVADYVQKVSDARSDDETSERAAAMKSGTVS